MNEREWPPARQSVLDRLIGHDPRAPAEPPATWHDSVRQIRASLLRDLEWLLNTRRVVEPAPAQLVEVRSSIYHFGMPDTTSLSRDVEETRQLIARQIADCIRTFEPRLEGVQVTAVDPDEDRHRIRFTVEAMLRLEPEPERVRFDTVLDVGSREFLVSADVDA